MTAARHAERRRRRIGGDRAVLASNVVARLVALAGLGIATVLVARTGGADAVGVLALLRVLPGLAGVLVSLGLPSAVPYFLSLRRDGSVRATLLVYTVTGAVLAALLWAAGSPVLRMAFFREQSLALVAWCAVAVLTQQLVAVGKSLLQGGDDLRGANAAIAAEEVSFLPVYLAVLAAWSGDVALVLALVVADLLVAVGIGVRLARRGFFTGLARPDPALAKEIAGYGLRGQIGGVLLLLNLRFDFALLGAIAGPAVLGVYAVASKYAELLRLPGLAVTYVLYPRFSKQGPQVARARTRALMPRATALTVLVAVPLGLLAGWLLPLLYGQQFRSAVLPAWILLAGLAGEGIAGLVTAYLYGTRRPGLNSLAMGAGVVCTVLLDLLLIPSHGAVGAAVASTVAYLLSTAVLLALFVRVGRGPAAEPSEALGSGQTASAVAG